MLNVLSLNVCGVMSRLQYPDFINFAQKYDILCFTETKTDHLDLPKLDNYVFEMKNRKHVRKRKSGGIILGFKEEIKEFIEVIDAESEYVLWFKISKLLTNTEEDVLCGIVYIPPQNSAYCQDNPFHEIELELLNFSQYQFKCLLGDFNARVSTDREFIEVDHCNIIDGDNDLFDNFVHTLQDLNLPLDRSSKDKKKNNFGNNLLDFCKGNNMFICNGRYGENSTLQTCKETSVVDYVIVSANLMKYIHDFSVLNFCSMLSDAHCPLCVVFNCINVENIDNRNNTVESEKIKKWDIDKSNIFLENIDPDRIANLTRTLNDANPDTYNENFINNSVETLCKIITDAAADTFGTFVPKRNKYQNSNNKPWFNRDCKEARQKYRKSKRIYRRNKNTEARQDMNLKAKQYKKIMNKFIREHKNKMKEKNDKLKSNNPREFWKIINDNQRKNCSSNIDLTTLFDYFKDLNETDYGEGDFPHVELNENEFVNNIINSEITEDEIIKAITKLRNNKAGSDDRIVNEYIKHSVDKTMHLYVKIFNIILDSSILPDEWLKGNIIPIYKQIELKVIQEIIDQ